MDEGGDWEKIKPFHDLIKPLSWHSIVNQLYLLLFYNILTFYNGHIIL